MYWPCIVYVSYAAPLVIVTAGNSNSAVNPGEELCWVREWVDNDDIGLNCGRMQPNLSYHLVQLVCSSHALISTSIPMSVRKFQCNLLYILLLIPSALSLSHSRLLTRFSCHLPTKISVQWKRARHFPSMYNLILKQSEHMKYSRLIVSLLDANIVAICMWLRDENRCS